MSAHAHRPMQATEEEMAAARIPLQYRDHCAHILIPLNKCRKKNMFMRTDECHDMMHTYERCQFALYQDREKLSKQQQLDKFAEKRGFWSPRKLIFLPYHDSKLNLNIVSLTAKNPSTYPILQVPTQVPSPEFSPVPYPSPDSNLFVQPNFPVTISDHWHPHKSSNYQIADKTRRDTHIHTNTHTRARVHTHTHTHSIYIYIYMYVCIPVCT